MSKKNAVLLRVGLCESCNGFLRVFFNKMSNKYGFAMGRIAMFFWFDLFFLVMTGKNNMLPKTDHICLFPSWPENLVFLAFQDMYIYIMILYMMLHYIPRFQIQMVYQKKDPKSAVPTQAKAAWMPRRDEITQWSSHDENRGIWPSTMGGVLSSTMKNQDLTRFLCMFDLFDHWIWGFPKMVRKIPNWWFQYQDSPTIWGYLYVRNPQFFVWVVIWVRFVDQSWNHKCCCHFHCNYSYTIWIFNIAMENGPFTDDFPIKTSIYHGFSIAMLNNQMVGVLQFWPEPLLCNEHFPMTYHWNSPTATCQTCQIQIFVGHSMGPNMA